MQKQSLCTWPAIVRHRYITKTLLVMKLTIILLTVGFFNVHANGISQEVTFSGKNVSLEKVFAAIERQTNYSVVYEGSLLKNAKPVSIAAEKQPLEKFLGEVLSSQTLDYAIENTTIIISKKRLTADFKSSVNSSSPQSFPPISGIVRGPDGRPLAGVSIIVKGSNIGTSTDANGSYSIDISKNDILLFSYLGYATKEVPVNGRSAIDVVMEENASNLDQVVVVGYGSLSKKSISGAVSVVSEKDFNKGVTRDAVDLLQGRVAGLTITKGSGDITDEQTIRLRGTSSLTGSSQPFIVIDGVPGLSLSSVAPQDIASISILKDASAAAIYGSRAASGVILITTKKGTASKTMIEYQGYVAVDNVTNIPKVLSAEQWRDYAADNNIDTRGIDRGGNTNWFKEIMRTGVTQNHSLSLSGGGKNNSYRASFSSLDQQGVVRDNSMQRYNARFMFNQKALDDRLTLTFTGAITERDYSPTDSRNFILAYNMIPVAPVKMEDGTWFDSQEYDQGNPLRNITYNQRLHKNSLYYINMTADFKITNDLVARLSLLKQRESNDYGEYNASQTERGRNELGNARRESWTRDKKLLEATLNYKKVFGEHNLNILAGYTYEDNQYRNAGAQNRQFVTDFFGYNNIGTGENLRPGDVWSGANMNKLISAFGRVNYMLQDKYVLAAAIRRDGSSKFGPNHRWGTFPSISAAWILNREGFLEDKEFLTDLKLRAGYGISGNQEGLSPYQSLKLYGPSGQYYDNGNWYQSFNISQNANPNLKWEETSMLNIGIDFGFFDNRISGTIDYYDKQTTDLLYTYQVPIPPYFISTMVANVGTMSNKGIELVINADLIRKQDLQWNVSMNVAHNKNKITKLSNDVFQTTSIKTGEGGVRGGSSNTTSIVEEGRDVGTFYGWVSEGLDKDGKYIMNDMIDGEPGLTDNDRTYIGSAQPKLTYGFSSSLTYKSWDLNFFFRGVYGNDLLNYSRMAYATTQWLPGANVLEEALTLGLTENPRFNSFYIEKGSFLRLDNANIAYNFNTKALWGIDKLRVYVTAQNLFTITQYKGLDPEVDMSGLAPGVEGRDYYPKSRTFSVGVNLSF